MNPVVKLCWAVSTLEGKRWHEMSTEALEEYDRVRAKLAEAEKQLKRLQDPHGREMTDLA